jgi:hypothetical protein
MGTTITQFGTEMKHHMTKISQCQYGIWLASPPTQKENRKRTVTSLDDSDSDSDSNNEDRNNDEEIHIKRHTQGKK